MATAELSTPVCPDCGAEDSVHVREQQLVEVPVQVWRYPDGSLTELTGGSGTIIDSDREGDYRCDCGYETDDLADFDQDTCEDCGEVLEVEGDAGCCLTCTEAREEYGA